MPLQKKKKKALSKNLSFVEGMTSCRAAGARTAHDFYERAFGEENICSFVARSFGVNVMRNMPGWGTWERQNDDELHQLQTWVLHFHVVLGYPGDRHVINTSRQTHFGGLPAAVGKLQIRNSNWLVTGMKNISQCCSVLGGLFLSRWDFASLITLLLERLVRAAFTPKTDYCCCQSQCDVILALRVK